MSQPTHQIHVRPGVNFQQVDIRDGTETIGFDMPVKVVQIKVHNDGGSVDVYERPDCDRTDFDYLVGELSLASFQNSEEHNEPVWLDHWNEMHLAVVASGQTSKGQLSLVFYPAPPGAIA